MGPSYILRTVSFETKSQFSNSVIESPVRYEAFLFVGKEGTDFKHHVFKGCIL
jgi:hypothetical protein